MYQFLTPKNLFKKGISPLELYSKPTTSLMCDFNYSSLIGCVHRMGLCNPLDIGIYKDLPCSQGRWHELASNGGVMQREYGVPIAHDPPAE